MCKCTDPQERLLIISCTIMDVDEESIQNLDLASLDTSSWAFKAGICDTVNVLKCKSV